MTRYEAAALVSAATTADAWGGRPALAARRCAALRAAVGHDVDSAVIDHLLETTHRGALHTAGAFEEAEAMANAAYEDAVRRNAEEQRAVIAMRLGLLHLDGGELLRARRELSEALSCSTL